MTTWYCKDSPDLKVGPGVSDADQVKFARGFLDVSPDDPRYAEKVGWIEHAARSYAIENLGEDAESVPEGEGFPCPECDKPPFKTAFGLKGHLRSHKAK